MVASYLLSKSAQRNKIKVLLAGNGADEIFGGYHRHYKTIKSLAKGKLSMFSDNFLLNLSWLMPNSYHKLVQLKYANISHAITFSGINLNTYNKLVKKCDFKSIDTILDKYFKINFKKNISFIKNMMIKDLQTYLLDNGLNILDKTTMAASIEGRVPYLDHELVEYLFGLNDKKYLSNNYNNSKPILKRYADKIGLNDISKRKKFGFNQPLEDIFSSKRNIEKIKNTLSEAKSYLSEHIHIDKLITNLNRKSLKNDFENVMNIYVLAQWFNKKHLMQ